MTTGWEFTQAATFNPQFNESVAPISSFQYRYALVLYLIANGHWLLLASLERSFIKLPVSQLSVTGLMGSFTDITFQMLLAGLQIAAPAAAVLMVTDVAFAFLNRAMPSMQVFYVGIAAESAGRLRGRHRRPAAPDGGGNADDGLVPGRRGAAAARDAQVKAAGD